ncbi:hypothetical protein ACQB60_22020 [Actinomycetota bacterium Odt1-20B]
MTVFARLALTAGFLSAVADRFGLDVLPLRLRGDLEHCWSRSR